MGGPTGTANASSSGGLSSAGQSGANAKNFGAQNQGFFSTLYGTPNPSGAGAAMQGGTLSKFLDPSSLNVNAPTGPYALQYQQAKANNALGTQQNAAAIDRAAGNAGFGAGAPSGYTNFLKSQNTQAGNTNAGNLFSQFAGNSYQDALSNFWKANQMAGSQVGTSGNQQNTAQDNSSQTYSQLYGTSQKAVSDSPANQFLGALGGGAGKAIGGKA